MKPLDFSIVVPVFNAAPYVERCAEALVSQGYPEDRYEILMADNNSTDGSAEIIRKFPRIKLLHEAEQSSYAARNRALREARGEIAAFTDPDCVPTSDWLERIAQAMAEPSTGIVMGDRRFANDSGVLGLLAAYESELGERIFTRKGANYYYAYTNNMAVRMPLLRETGGFLTVKRGGDALFMRGVVAKYGEGILKYEPRMLVRHLEIAGIRDYLDKKRIYGQTNGKPALATPSALSLGERLSVALKARRVCRGSLADSAGFACVLAAGALSFEWQRIKGGGR